MPSYDPVDQYSVGILPKILLGDEYLLSLKSVHHMLSSFIWMQLLVFCPKTGYRHYIRTPELY